jgi:adenine-specific DNA-methyltransferase
MAKQLQKLELTWIGKGNEPKLEPRILVEDPSKSYGDIQSENLLIHGDNLLALKALEQNYAGKIKCIYIDPPYNTGNAFEHYDDGIEHSLWLSLMKPRLDILRSLLRDDGSIWINLDDSEVHYLKVLCDEIFGRDNFRSFITWQRKYSVSNNFKGIASICDYILVYSKSNSFQNNLLARSDESKSRYNNPDNDPRGPWKSVDYLNQATPSQRKNLCYDIKNPNTGVVIKNTKKAWKYDPNTHKIHVAENRIWWGLDGKNTTPALKLFLSEVRDGMTPYNWWSHQEVGHTDEAKKESINLFGSDFSFSTPKPERLIQRVLELATNENDIVLDSFLGSGTTAAVAHKMKRKWIGIELGEHAITHSLPRLKKVVSGDDKGGISESVNWKKGGGFKFYTLAPSLIQKDKYGTEIINPQYNANMLAAAMAKQEGFRYQPDENNYWKQGMSSEKDFIFTTTQFVTVAMLDKLAEKLQPGESLLVCCKSFAKGCANRHNNITIKKIPQMLLGRCEFGKDDYSFNIVNLPHDNGDFNIEYSEESEAPKPEKKSKAKKQKDDDTQSSLF